MKPVTRTAQELAGYKMGEKEIKEKKKKERKTEEDRCYWLNYWHILIE